MVGCRVIVLQSELIDTVVVPREAAMIIRAGWRVHEWVVIGAGGPLIIWLHQMVSRAELAGGRLEQRLLNCLVIGGLLWRCRLLLDACRVKLDLDLSFSLAFSQDSGWLWCFSYRLTVALGLLFTLLKRFL